MEPFQEWPQLLDPHLSSLLQPLVSAFVDYASKHVALYHQEGKHCPGIIPLPRAISKILYVFCKVRGTKVISQFLNNEPRYLELMLDAFESWSGKMDPNDNNATPKHGFMVWEERFVMLLWLSHLLLAPFDLSSMSSDNAGLQLGDSQLHVVLPTATPPIAKRLVSASTYHLSLSSKAREAAGTLLVRLAVRTDMQKIGLQKVLVDWALSWLRAGPNAASPASVYGLIGILSFLAGFITSAGNEVLKPLLSRIYNTVQYAIIDQSSPCAGTSSPASARKFVIKVERALAVAGMRIDSEAEDDSDPSLGEGALEEIIDHLLTALEDKDTPVRLAASKGLSVIAVELEPDMVEQIIDMIDTRLFEDTLWEDPRLGTDVHGNFGLNLGTVSASRWHGLILAISQLIFRGSMPPGSVLGKVIFSLIVALRFEQRSSLGNSVGTSVRDAACFGLWALARRYSTAEINKCRPLKDQNHDAVLRSTRQIEENESKSAADSRLPTKGKSNDATVSTLQILANELVVAATLDPAGNIRRGASAALQEMIGRHPEQIKRGIDLVQVVDYHGIALRSRAMTQIAISVSQIEPTYWRSIFFGLVDWRGVCSGDAECRRNAALAIELLTHNQSYEMTVSNISTLRHRLQAYDVSMVEERHGLLLALSNIVSRWSDAELGNPSHPLGTMEPEIAGLWHTFHHNGGSLKLQSKERFTATDTKSLRSPLTCEAVCSLIAALANSLIHALPPIPLAELQECYETVQTSLRQSDEIALAASTKAAGALFQILDHDSQQYLISRWAQNLNNPSPGSTEGSLFGVVTALGTVFQHVQIPQSQNLIMDTLTTLVSDQHGMNLRCTALRTLKLNVLESNGRVTLYSSFCRQLG